MFDRTTVNAVPSHVSMSTHEHRAPTDESVKLLSEMEEKARRKIIRSAILEGDGIEVAYAWYREDPETSGSRIDMLFRFNRKDETISVKISARESARLMGDKGAFAQLVVEKISAAISANLGVRLERVGR